MPSAPPVDHVSAIAPREAGLLRLVRNLAGLSLLGTIFASISILLALARMYGGENLKDPRLSAIPDLCWIFGLCCIALAKLAGVIAGSVRSRPIAFTAWMLDLIAIFLWFDSINRSVVPMRVWLSLGALVLSAALWADFFYVSLTDLRLATTAKQSRIVMYGFLTAFATALLLPLTMSQSDRNGSLNLKWNAGITSTVVAFFVASFLEMRLFALVVRNVCDRFARTAKHSQAVADVEHPGQFRAGVACSFIGTAVVIGGLLASREFGPATPAELNGQIFKTTGVKGGVWTGTIVLGCALTLIGRVCLLGNTQSRRRHPFIPLLVAIDAAALVPSLLLLKTEVPAQVPLLCREFILLSAVVCSVWIFESSADSKPTLLRPCSAVAAVMGLAAIALDAFYPLALTLIRWEGRTGFADWLPGTLTVAVLTLFEVLSAAYLFPVKKNANLPNSRF
jgi:hypothetical protein